MDMSHSLSKSVFLSLFHPNFYSVMYFLLHEVLNDCKILDNIIFCCGSVILVVKKAIAILWRPVSVLLYLCTAAPWPLFMYMYSVHSPSYKSCLMYMFPTRLLTSEDECKWF